jgi:hypothetical protein
MKVDPSVGLLIMTDAVLLVETARNETISKEDVEDSAPHGEIANPVDRRTEHGLSSTFVCARD